MRGADADVALQNALADLLDGKLDATSQQELNDRLQNDPAARQLYLDFCEMHASLAWQHGYVLGDITTEPAELNTDLDAHETPGDRVAGSRVSDTRVTDPGTHQDSHGKGGKRTGLVAAALGLAACMLLGWFWLQRESSSPTGPAGQVVAELVHRIDATVTSQGEDWLHGELRVGRYAVHRGLIDIRFPTGVAVLIESPADFEVLSASRLVLFEGRLSADVPPAGIGFTVETPEAEVVDYGTEFSVEVNSGESEVHVFRGHVRVHPKAERSELGNAVDLRTDQAIRINDATRRPAGIDLAKDRFIRSIDEPTHRYPKQVKSLGPVAFYRMPIRVRGLACVPPKYRGQVVTGDGVRPACAPGVFGGSLRVGGRSIGRGAFVPKSIPLENEMSIAGWVYAESRPEDATIAMQGNPMDFVLGLDQGGRLAARGTDSRRQTFQCKEAKPLELNRWHFVVLTQDGKLIRLYRDALPVAEISFDASVEEVEALDLGQADDAELSPSDGLWIGTDPAGDHLWDGRIDELSFFDRALSEDEIQLLFEAAERS